ncbi:DUF1413 domain-containing protein [Staphylococcus cohnii species complex 1637]|uniref:DUF1413 domain-containing protein n=1 Tax=Staphylococcus cohnii species complex 1637 TaxID=3239426 RepID=UPI0034D3E4D1
MNFTERIKELRNNIDSTSSDFRFEQLFNEEEWLGLSLNQRQQYEREFRKYVTQSNVLRISYASQDHIRMRMYNSIYNYNEIKHNFKSYV